MKLTYTVEVSPKEIVKIIEIVKNEFGINEDTINIVKTLMDETDEAKDDSKEDAKPKEEIDNSKEKKFNNDYYKKAVIDDDDEEF